MNLFITNTDRPTCVIKLLQHLVNSLFYIDIYEINSNIYKHY